jgi:hypothetical protein
MKGMEEQTVWTRGVGVVFFLLITAIPKLHGVGEGFIVSFSLLSNVIL